MARSVNKVILVGRVGRDPEVRITRKRGNSEDTLEATASLVTEQDGETIHCHRIRMTGKLATFAQEYVTKGDRVYVEGRLMYDSYERNGVTIPTAEIAVRELVLLAGSPEGNRVAR